MKWIPPTLQLVPLQAKFALFGRRHQRAGTTRSKNLVLETSPLGSDGLVACADQNEYFNENWIKRGVPTTEVTWVNELPLSISVFDGFANDG